MSVSQADKAAKFQALHAGPRAFVIANPWDAGSARLLAGVGFEALATSSGAKAGVLGRRDGAVSRAESLANARLIVDSCDLPVAADLEQGFGDTPEDAAETIRQACGVGLVGGSIEDWSGTRTYDLDHAVARMEAASKAARSLPVPFVLTGRCEGFLRGAPDLDETIRRLQAYEKVGADVLMAPGLPDLDAVKKVCASLSKPFSFMAGIKGKSFDVASLEAAGVRRISLATALYRAAMGGLLEAAREVKDHGSFGFLDRALSSPQLGAFMKP